MTHIGYEVIMCASSCLNMVKSTGNVRYAFLESELIHARALFEFLTTTKRPRSDDIVRTDFAEDWEPSPADAVATLKDQVPDIHKNLAHLTWARVDDQRPVPWSYVVIATNIVAVAWDWAVHVTESEGKHIDDPQAVAHGLLLAIKQARADVDLAVVLAALETED
jgi:hypothetical protein